jgi:fructose-1,6-bisphosphatase/inositol monophosphatase family enzyme
VNKLSFQDLNDVSDLIREVASGTIMPRYRTLNSDEVMTKSKNEMVTVVDRAAEAQLAAGLKRIKTGATFIGEEGVEAGTANINALTSGGVWLVDPLDGTSNFARGEGSFGVMIAYLVDGEAQDAWLYDPVLSRLCTAKLGGGSYIDGLPVISSSTGDARPVAALATQFMSPDERSRVTAAAELTMALTPIPRCAAEHYPRLVIGVNDIALFQRTLPWDHIPGALFLTEAGGAVARWDGTPYSLHDDQTGLVAASSPELLASAVAALKPALMGIHYGLTEAC